MDTYKVSFMPKGDNMAVEPPFETGKQDSTWVKAISDKDAIEQARKKMQRVYGIEIDDPVVCG